MLRKKLRDKSGTILVFGMLIIMMTVWFTVLVVDLSLGFAYRVQLQHISDAAALGGAHAGQDADYHPTTRKPRSYIHKELADPVANEIISRNLKYLPSKVTVSHSINPNGELGMSHYQQYYQGSSLTVVLKGKVKTFFQNLNNFFSTINIHSLSRVKVFVEE